MKKVENQYLDDADPQYELTRYGVKDHTTGEFYKFTKKDDEFINSLSNNKGGIK